MKTQCYFFLFLLFSIVKIEGSVAKSSEDQTTQNILSLNKIIDNPNASHLEKYNAFLQKSKIYKSLYNYSEASHYLEKALKEGLLIDNRKKAETTILIEKLLLYFDQRKTEEFLKLSQTLDEGELMLVDDLTRALYYITKFDFSLDKKDYDDAKLQLSKIFFILKNAPEHLPLYYGKKAKLNKKLELYDQEFEAAKMALKYAEKYQNKVYEISSYEVLESYYFSRNDYKNAWIMKGKSTGVKTEYDAINRNSSIMRSEGDYYQNKNAYNLQSEKNFRNTFVITSFALLILLFFLIKLFRLKKKHNIIVEKENTRMRSLLEKLLSDDEKKKNETLLPSADYFKMTNRQQEIIMLVKEGRSNKEIATQLYISENTVKYHLKVIFNLLNIDNRLQLTNFTQYSTEILEQTIA